MIIPEKNRREISKYLFQEGVCYAKKDYNLPKHPEIDVPNLQVIKLMQSFKSKEYVRETFAWMHYYWYLTNDGIEFLRTYLNLPSEIVPATLKKSSKPLGRPMGGPPGDRPRFCVISCDCRAQILMFHLVLMDEKCLLGPPRFEGDRPRFGDRDGYRGGPRGPAGEFGGEKGESGAPADYQPAFRMEVTISFQFPYSINYVIVEFSKHSRGLNTSSSIFYQILFVISALSIEFSLTKSGSGRGGFGRGSGSFGGAPPS
ncbi:40S ribosomal protein S10-like [Striga asiatica]|uniref:40S ribosomal protein S10-like n=1 Tax=Striga asiatica TaxID=4170 RepID=A0A5A7R3V0_STRAF|nr:40S ribosomal protein S10-like [Striga asiatica]